MTWLCPRPFYYSPRVATRLCLQGIDVSGIIASRGRWCPIKPASLPALSILAPNDSFYSSNCSVSERFFGRPADPASLTAFPASGMTDEQIVEQFVATSSTTPTRLLPTALPSPGGGVTRHH